MKNIKLALVVTLAFAALFISFYNFFYLKSVEGRLQSIEKYTVEKGNLPDADDTESVVEDEVSPNDGEEVFIGTLRKEAIPAELELGDYWYWLYFDEPYTLEENASGLPLEVDKLQITMGSDELDGKHVIATGKIGWGYAESSVIEATNITAD